MRVQDHLPRGAESIWWRQSNPIFKEGPWAKMPVPGYSGVTFPTVPSREDLASL